MNLVTRALLAVGLMLAASGPGAQPLRVAETRSPAVPAGVEPDAAQVLLSEGSTMLVRGASFSSPVRRDVPLRSGDRIRTGADGRVQLRFSDGALMSIQPGSDFRIDAYAFDALRQRGFFELMQGSVRTVSGSIGKRDREDWRLKTPTATIGIRGTEFTVEETPCPATGCAAGSQAGLMVSVIAGRVAVSNDAGSVEVPAGSTIRLRDAKTIPVLAAAPVRAPRGAAPAGRPGAGDAMVPLEGPRPPAR